MRRVLTIAGLVLGVVVLVLVGLFAALSFIPDSVKRDKLTAMVKQATGRELTIGGDIKLSLFPKFGFEANDVALANASGFGDEPMARMKKLAVGVEILPLIRGAFVLDEFLLIDPEIALEVNEGGENNWTFKTTETPAEAEPAESEPSEPGGAPIKSVTLGTVQLSNGHISFNDRQKKQNWELSDINLDVTLESLESPLGVQGSLVWKGQKVSLLLNADSLTGLQSANGSPLSVKVSSDLLGVDLRGSASTQGSVRLWGKAGVTTPSIRDLSAWLAKPMAPGRGFGPFELNGDLDVNGDVTRFENATVRFDEIRGTGSLLANTGGERPYIKAALAVDTLNADLYMSAAPVSADAGAPASGGSASGNTGGANGGTAPAPASTGWSTEKIDVSGLRTADADLAFKAKTIVAQGLTFTNSALNVSLKNGVLNATLSEMALYGGRGTAKLVLDGSGTEAALKTDLAFSGIAIEPLLKDAAKFDRLTGTGNLDLSIVSRGGSQRALVQNLNGSGGLKLANGAVRGINIAAMVRNLAGAFAGGASGGAQQTDFAEMGGTFTIANGVLSNTDLLLLNPLLRITGQGTTNLVDRTVDYHILPKAVATIEGQGGKADLSGIAVPVKVTGSWDNLSFAPDPKGFVSGAKEGLTKALQSGENPLKGALQGALGKTGGQEKTEGGSEQPASKDPAQQLLKGILR